MLLNEINLAIIGIVLGAFLGAVGIKLVTDNNKTNWKWAFYIAGGVSILIVFDFIVSTFPALSSDL